MKQYVKQILYFPSRDTVEKLKRKANEKGMCMSTYVRMVLLERWEREENEENARRNGK